MPVNRRRNHHEHRSQPTEGNPTGVRQAQTRAVVTLDVNRAMTVKQAIFTLAPTLERMKKRGFDTQEIVEKLHEKGIEVKPQTLTKYLTEARRQREGRKAQKRDTPPRPPRHEQRGSFIVADIPDDEL